MYALDSTTIDLCLTPFPWAQFRKTKAAVKMHTLLNLRGSIPEFVHISDGKRHDVNVLDLLIPEPGACSIMDRGYIDFARLLQLHHAGAFFVTRAKQDLRCRRRYSRPVDKSTGLGADLPALVVAELYKARWRVELFFKRIKQHLRIKAFSGTSDNAVRTQIWTAVSVYVLVAIIRKRLQVHASLYTMLQILSIAALEKIPLSQARSQQKPGVIPDDSERQSWLL